MSADRAAASVWRCAARVLDIPLPALRRLTGRELEMLLRRALVAAQDALAEGRMP